MKKIHSPNTQYSQGDKMKLDPILQQILTQEKQRQEECHHFIASENGVSQEVRHFVGSEFTNKYAEGYPGRRYYNGCENFDALEKRANELVRKLYGCNFSNVQPHSGANANLAVYKAFLKPGDTTLGMDLTAGGHLSHGSGANMSGQWFDAQFYNVGDDGWIDYNLVRERARETKPKLLIAGGSAYPREIDWQAFRSIADEVGALFLVDMAHYSGLIAGGVYKNPLPYADIVTSTTHKTLRGARGGMILWNKKQYAKKINSGVFPGTQGGPLMNHIAGKAQAFYEASQPEFRQYAYDVVMNAKLMAEVLKRRGVKVSTNGTDSHIVLIHTGDMTGKDVANRLQTKYNIIVNKNTVPNDPRSVVETSGIRIGTAAMTTKKGHDANYFASVAEIIADVIGGY